MHGRNPASQTVRRKMEFRVMRRIVVATLIACAALSLSLAVMEVMVRLIGYTDANGQFVFRNSKLPPYMLPLGDLNVHLQTYFEDIDKLTVIPDPETGWTYRPNSLRQNGEFTINSAGLRARREYSLQPPTDSLRIALFGDSFVAGDEVTDQETWGWQLEQKLIQKGLRTEVLNFGVGGFGMGQAFLRWQSLGKGFDPDIVIFVFQAENLDRNVNVFRLLYPQRGLVYSKARFTLEDGRLTLLNSPALPPEKLQEVFEAFDSHPLAEFEAYYSGREYPSPLWKVSKLAGLAHVTLNRRTPAQVYGPDSERGQLGKAIAEAFAADVIESGAAFIVLHLPRFDHLRAFHAGKSAPWQFLLDHFDQSYHFINAEDFLGVEYTDNAYYQPGNHYGPEIHAIIAEAVSEELVMCMQEETCELSRFEKISEIRN